jgi:predicted DNA-binding protein
MENWKQLTLRIPEEIHSKLKIIAAIKKKPMRDLVVEMIEEYDQRYKNDNQYAKFFDHAAINKVEMEPSQKIDKEHQAYEYIYNLRNTGCSYRQIADALNNDNIPTLSGRGKWHAQTVYNFIKYKIL